MPPRKQLYQFKIALKDISPPIWRRIQVPSTYTFWDLHIAIQDAMGWLDCHLHEFRIRDLNGRMLNFGIPDEDFENQTLPGWKHKISKYISLARPTFEYVYDFGDDWRHKVELEEVLPIEPGADYPRCIKGKRSSARLKTAEVRGGIRSFWTFCQTRNTRNTREARCG